MRTSPLILRMMSGPVWEGEGGGGGGGGAAAAAAAAAAGGGGGSGGGGGDGGGGQQQQQQNGGQQQQQQSGAWTPPADLPEQFKGATAEEALGKLLPAYAGLRTQLAAKPGAPEKPEGYTFKPADDVAKYFGEVDKNPALAVARTAAHKHGLTQTQFDGFINEVYGSLAKSGGLAEPYNPSTEVKAYADAGGFDGKAVAQHFQENVTFAKGLIAQLGNDLPPKLAASAQAELDALTDTAGGNALLKALSARLAQSGIRFGGQPSAQGGPLSAEDLKKLDADPRIDPRNANHQDADKRYDEALRKRYDEGYAALGRQQNGGRG